MNQAFLDYYRCPESFADFRSVNGTLGNGSAGYFRIGSEIICYGKSGAKTSPKITDSLPDLLPEIQVHGTTCALPFDPTEVADSLRFERYVSGAKKPWWKRLVRGAYYYARPVLPVPVRRHLQRAWLSGRSQNNFPCWPVDRTVDRMFEALMFTSASANKDVKIPFIWFWPDRKSSAAMMTHDVETRAGLDFVNELMDLNDSFGIKSSFQIIPEERYAASDAELSAIRSRGFEINVHDLKHDGHLFDDHQEFLKSAQKINEYAKRYGSKGFRAGVLYREQNWFSAFSFSYDMSVPNSAHFDPQPGGCCTVMPYFVGDILELPVTTIQDYSLFNIVNTYSLDLWREQIAQITNHHGLASFIVHPDYLTSRQATDAYAGLLSHLDALRSNQQMWIALPAQIDEWWRQRSKMRLVPHGETWKVEGAGSDRATVAYAIVADNRLEYRLN